MSSTRSHFSGAEPAVPLSGTVYEGGADRSLPSDPGVTALGRIHRAGVVPVVELADASDAVPLIAALVAGGLPVAEITLRTPAALPAIRSLHASHPDVLVGAGTVRLPAEARLAVEAGAQFVVSPSFNPEVIAMCRKLGVPMIPGACTPTEVDAAVRAQVNVVKLFPVEPLGGARFVRALAGPFPDVRFLPTGGIDVCSLRDYLEIPQVVACGGSWMVAPRLVSDRRFDRVEELAREVVAAVEAARSHA